MNHYEVLKAARRLIENEERWTQGAAACDANGRYREAQSPFATCWCGVGVLTKVGATGTVWHDAYNALDRATMHLHGVNPVRVNDDLGHQAIMLSYDRAIDIALKEVIGE
jgi:hypothetical protein